MTGPVVEMFRYTRGASAPDTRAFPAPIWDLLWELGRAFGWRPTGTTYVVPPNSPVEMPALRNYEPGGTQDHKRVEEEDAIAWARALDQAKASRHTAAMIDAQSLALASSGKETEELHADVLDDFVEFVRGGAFEFGISGERVHEAEVRSGTSRSSPPALATAARSAKPVHSRKARLA